MTSVKQFPDVFMISFAMINYSLSKHGVHIINHGPVYSKTDGRAGEDLGCGYLGMAIKKTRC